MSFEFDLPDISELEFRLVIAGMLLVIALFAVWPAPRARHLRRVHRWARENLVTFTSDVESALDKAMWRRGVWTGAIIACASAAIAIVPLPVFGDDDPPIGGWLIVVGMGICLNFVLSFQITRPWFPPGTTATARLRTVHLSDYVPRLARIAGWAAAVACLVSIALLPLTGTSSGFRIAYATLAVGIAVALVIAEIAGRRAAASPEPARNEIELYAQDAWRADLAQYCYRNLALWGGFALTLLSFPDRHSALALTVRFSGFALLALCIVSMLIPYPGVKWVRRQLWPKLGPSEFIGLGAVA